MKLKFTRKSFGGFCTRMLLAATVLFTMSQAANAQCVSAATSTADEDIFRVQFGTLNNSSTCATTGTGAGSLLNRYSNYTSGPGAPAAPSIQQGQTLPITIQVGTCGTTNYANNVAAYIDFDHDGNFIASERVYVSNFTGSGPHTETGNVTIPFSSLTGTAILRVLVVEFGTAASITGCGTYSWGETEDYNISITAAPPCSGTPAPGNTLASAANACSGATVNFSIQNFTTGSGVTYQWQTAASATGPWTNVTGATSAVYSAVITSTQFYRVNVTCGAATTASNPVQVTLNPPNQCYCTSNATTTADEEILNVTVGGLNQSSTCTSVGPGPGSLQSQYSNYTTGTGAPAPATIIAGANNPFSVAVGTCGTFNYTNTVAIFIDLNQDGDFIDAGERVYGSPGSSVGAHTETGNLNIPAGATLGQTRMRVISVETSPSTAITPCGTYGYGETEDYLVNIIPCVQAAITGQPANTSAICGTTATFTASATGSFPTFQWEYRTSATSPWVLLTSTAPYSISTSASGTTTTSTLTISPVDGSMNGYQYRAIVTGACTGSGPDFTNAGTLTVTQLVLPITPTSTTKCLADPAVLIAVPNTQSVATSTNNTPVTVPDNTANGVISTNTISGVPAGANIISVDVKFSMAHTYVGDMIFNLKAPNGVVIALDKYLSGTANQAGTYPNIGFVNTVISSLGTTSLGTAASQPITGTYKADFINTPITGPTVQNPTGYVSTATAWSQLASSTQSPNGTWTLAMADGGPGDVGTLSSWTITVTYGGAPATATFTPITGLYTNAAGTTPYTGGSVTQVYAAPTTSTTYSAVVTAGACSTAAQTIQVNVNAPVGGTATLTNNTVCAGDPATFTLGGALTGGPGFTYQWQVATAAAPTVFTNITGATSTSYTVTGSTVAQSGNIYHVVISTAGASGSCGTPLTSQNATLTVNPTPVVVISAAPTTRLYPGLTTTLTAASTPSAVASYQWFRNGVAVPGATSNKLVVNIDGLGTYTVKVTDVNGCTNGASRASTPSSITIGDSVNNEILFIYPTPNTGRFQVRYFTDASSLANAPYFINVYDEKGQRVFTRSYSSAIGYSPMNVDLAAHGKGVYRVELTNSRGERIKTGSVLVF